MVALRSISKIFYRNKQDNSVSPDFLGHKELFNDGDIFLSRLLHWRLGEETGELRKGEMLPLLRILVRTHCKKLYRADIGELYRTYIGQFLNAPISY
jgi:hypothetical protein